MPITICAEAAEKIKERMDQEGGPDTLVLRINAEMGPARRLNYTLKLETRGQSGPRDHISVQHGITIVIDPESQKHIQGSAVCYREEGLERGFAVIGPGKTHCFFSCGISCVRDGQKKNPKPLRRERGMGVFFFLLYIKAIFVSNAATYGTLLIYFLIFGKTDTTAAVTLHYLAATTAMLAIVPMFMAAIPFVLLMLPVILSLQ